MEIIKEILQIDKRARDIVAEAGASEEDIKRQIDEKGNVIRKDIKERAKIRIEKNKLEQEKELELKIHQIEETTARRLIEMDKEYGLKAAVWEEEILTIIEGRDSLVK